MEQMKGRLHLQGGEGEAIVRPLHAARRKWLAVAAACILLTGAAYMLTHQWNQSVKPSPSIARSPWIAPGGDKAILTLGNGSRIILDSAADGTLAEQGATKIVKLANGRLAYQLAGNQDQATVKVLYNTMETPRGGVYQLTLPDGTRVWLNSASSIRYPNVFTGPKRAVEVTGEAYFDVARDEAKPFVVSSRGMQVQVLGTEFNLMAYTDEEAIRTTLVNGSIKVVSGGASKLIKPDEQAVLRPDSAQLHIARLNVVKANLNEVLAWKDGNFRFYSTKITDIMRQLARWYDVDIVYQGAPPQDDFYCVISKKQYASQILDILEQTDNVHFKIDGRKIIVIAGSK